MGMISPQSRIDGTPWNQEDDDPLWLLTPEELQGIPDGTLLHSIVGWTGIKGTDDMDTDTRFGFTAWGLRESQLPELPQEVL